MPPSSNEIDGAYYFAFVCLSVFPFVKVFYACHILRTLYARVLKFYILVSNEKTADPYFFPCPTCLLCPQLQRSWRGILLLGCSSVRPSVSPSVRRHHAF